MATNKPQKKPALSMDSFWASGAVGALKAIAFVCDIITYPVYFLIQRPWEKKANSRRAKAKSIAIEDSSITFRSTATAGPIHQSLIREEVDTLAKVLPFMVSRYANRRALGTRDILAEEDEVQSNGRVFKKYVMGDFKWLTFAELDANATAFGSGLRQMGNEPKSPVVIFAETRAEWMIAAHGLFKQNIPLVTIYATLGLEAIAHGINETEVTTVITTHELLPKFHEILKLTPRVNTLIYMEDQLVKTPTSGFEGINVLSYNEVLAKGSKPVAPVSPTPEDIAIIMYTSGSTGVPKGVLLSHSNMMCTMKAFTDAVKVQEDDVFMGYLPLAHVFELLSESACLTLGLAIGYSTPLTMIDSSSKIKRGTKGDARVLKPTVISSVPLILDRIYKGVQDKVSNGGTIPKILFSFAYDYKQSWTRRGFDTPLINKLVFGKTREILGGRLRYILSGGAPLSPDTHSLIKNCLCVTVIQGYGLTESTSSASVMDINDMSTGRVGAPTIGCDVRMVDWTEGNYTVKDKPYPRGELVLGGANISQGYFKLAEKSKEDFFIENGRQWFKTGDIAEVHPDGCFKIIDRKKDLVKLQAGEYVSLGKVEAELKTCPVVENICVYGDSSKHFCVALVVPNETHLVQLTSSNPNDDFDELCKTPKAENIVLRELQAHAKKGKLEKFEVPQAVKLCSEVWSPDMGLVTAAFKLKRKDIQARYQNEINRMYAS